MYFTDVGTLCYLTGLKDVDHLLSGPMAGAIVETYVVSEIYKRLSNRGTEPQIYFWRTSAGTEVDILLDDQGTLIPIEVKATATPKPQMASGVRSIQKDLKKQISNGYVIHIGDIQLPLGEKVTALPFAQL